MIIKLLAITAMIGAFVWYSIMRQYDKDEAEAARRKKEAEEREQEDRRLIEESRRRVAMTEALNQATMVGAADVCKAITDGTYSGPLPVKTDGRFTSIFSNLLILPINGINYRHGIKAYVGSFKGVLVPEPTNDYDPDAMMIKCEYGHHPRYIPEDRTADVRRLVGMDFERHRISGVINEVTDVDDNGKPRAFFTGYVYITP